MTTDAEHVLTYRRATRAPLDLSATWWAQLRCSSPLDWALDEVARQPEDIDLEAAYQLQLALREMLDPRGVPETWRRGLATSSTDVGAGGGFAVAQKKGGCGTFIVIAVLALIAYKLFFSGGGSEFNCEALGGGGVAVAHADTGDCPSTAQDAAKIISTIADKPLTAGVLYDDSGKYDLESGQDSDADLAVDMGRDAGAFGRGVPNVVDHVEVKAAAKMRSSGATHGFLAINNPAGPCGENQPLGCYAVTPRILPKDSTLVVWWQETPGSTPKHHTFRGG